MIGDVGEALYMRKGNSWWRVQKPDTAPEDWRQGGSGYYAPFDAILNTDGPSPDGTIVKVKVEVVRA
ncbi:MAG TPA: hypothetical protein VFW80_08555 [Gaiellaceae bacterium]|nr:hypothetical protein [Gaiellaceae bacterium]